ncbi:MAG: TPM domain-containing protein [Erythrobacter sp.]
MLRPALASLAALLMMSCAAEAEQPTAAEQSAAAGPALELTGRVVDAADIISAAGEERLTAKLAALETDTGVQLVVATTPDLEGRDIAAYSVGLAREWGIGSAERDDGLILLIAPNERKARIDVGYGLEASVKDDEAAAILRQSVLPLFRTGDYEAGVLAGVERLIAEVTPYELKEAA